MDQSDPRLLVILAFAAPIGQGAAVIDRLSRLVPAEGADAAATRVVGNAAMAVGAFDVAAASLAASAVGLRAQGPARPPQASARAASVERRAPRRPGRAIPAAEVGRRLAQETNQPLVMATAQAVRALLAALRGDRQAAAALAAQAERVGLRSPRREVSWRWVTPDAVGVGECISLFLFAEIMGNTLATIFSGNR